MYAGNEVGQNYYCPHCLKDFGRGHHCCDCDIEADRLPTLPNQVLAKCINLKCRTYTWDHDDISDWVDQHGRMRFYIPEEDANTYSGVIDVHPLIDLGTYEYAHKEKICCSLCNEGAAFTNIRSNHA